MRRRLIVIVLLALVVVSGAWTIAWYVAAHRLIDVVDRWAAARRAEGWQVGHGTPTLAGFPAKIAVEFADPAITGPAPRAGGGGSWEWRAPAVRVEFVPWRPHRVVLRNAGTNHLGLTRDAQRYDATLATDGAMVRLEFGRQDGPEGGAGGAQYVIELVRPKLRLATPPVAAEATQLALTAERHSVAPGDHMAVAADLDVAVDGLVAELFDKSSGLPVSAHLRAELMGALPPGPIESALPAWRDDGGTVEVRRLALQSSGITLVTNGTLALDNQMRPMGAATAVIRGYDEGLDRLTAAGTVNRRDAQLAKLLLSAIAAPNAEGERVLNVPITGQDGWLYVGPVRLTRLDPLKLR